MATRYGAESFGAEYGRAWSLGDETLLRQYFTEDAMYVDGGTETVYQGLENIARFYRMLHTFSSGTIIEFTSIVGDAGSFAADWVRSGVATGLLTVDGVSHGASERTYRVEGIALCRTTADGRVSYHGDYYELQHLMRQVAPEGDC